MTHDSPVLAALYAGQDPPAAQDADLDVFEAAALGRSERVEELIAADPSRARAAAPDGFSALHLTAFFSGDAGIARALLDAGADPGAVANNDMRVTPLNSAVARGHRAVAGVLLERGAPVDARQAAGFTALHGAAANGDEAFVDLLIEHGADAGGVADDGARPADLAAANQHAELANRLRGLEG